MRTITPRRWPVGLFLVAILGLVAMALPTLAGATDLVPEPACVECDPRPVDVTFTKFVCENDAVIPLNSGGAIARPVTPIEYEGCTKATAGTWTFLLSATNGGTPYASGGTVTNGTTQVTGDAAARLLSGEPLWVREVTQSGYEFAALRCYMDAVNDDNSEYIQLGVSPQCSRCDPPPIHCVAYNRLPEEPRTDLVEIEKAWIINSGGAMPALPIDDFVTVRAYDAAQVEYGDPVVCDADATGKLVMADLGWACAIEVPEGGFYRVTENVPGGFAVTGANSGTFYQPGDSDFCVPRDNGVVLFSEMNGEVYGHCVRNDDIPPPPPPPPPPPVTVPSEARASVVLDKDVVGGPTDLAGLEFTFTLTCGSTELPITIGLEGDSGPVGSFPVGTVCEIEEGDLPTPPEGYEWVDVEALDVTLAASGENDVTFTNELTAVQGEEVVPPTEPTVAPTTVVVSPEALPRTGGNGELTITALATVLVGMGLVLLARRREALS
jgi:LPXTG-motif cell wall-anchored protein